MTCGHLAGKYGGVWLITKELDSENVSTPSPDVEVSNGTVTAAIEVKRLTVAELERYHNWKPSLERYLAPPCPGHFFLLPCINFRLPLDKPMMRYLQKEIARAAPTIPPQASDVVLIPRDGYVVKLNGNLPGQIWCTVHDSHEGLQGLGTRLDGWYYLIEDNPWAHNFVTDESRAAWHDSIIAGCETPTIQGRFTWNEEWKLMRLDDGDNNERHFEILAASDVFTGGSADAAIWTMLERGTAKFHQRWADHHILVFDSRVPSMINANRLAAIAGEFDADDLGAVEMILLVDGNELAQIWPR